METNMAGNSQTLQFEFDSDVAELNGLIDEWLSYLKCNILNEFIQNKTGMIQLKQQELESQEQRYRNEIIKFQSEINDLKNKVSMRDNQIYKLKYGTRDPINDATITVSIEQNESNGLRETSLLPAKQERCCKDLLRRALLYQRKKNQTFKLFHKWRLTCKAKQIHRRNEQLADMKHERSLIKKILKEWRQTAINRVTTKMKNQGVPARDRMKFGGSSQQMEKPDSPESILAEEASDEIFSRADESDIQQRTMDEKTSHRIQKKDLACEICGKCFLRQAKLLHHILAHQEKSRFKCEVCQAEFTQQALFNEHMELYHSYLYGDPVNSVVENVDGGDTIITHDIVTYDTVPFNVDTNDTVLLDSTAENDNVEKIMLTHGIVLTQDTDVHDTDTHDTKQRGHHRRQKMTQRKGSLSAPVRTHVKGQRPQKVDIEGNGSAKFQCNRCQKVFKEKYHLFQHQVYVHNKSSKFQCTRCDKYLPGASALRDHMSFHDGIKKFVCELCNKRFNTKGILKNHMRTHTGERPFGCELCEQKFSSKGIMLTHMRIHTGEKPYVCELCGKEFAQSGNLKVHMKSHISVKS